MSRSHTVICTAGHIDHGKSSLMLNLTGYDPDVLREEQEREMTIELGFVFYGDDVTIIDVPGHEKFLKTMLAGVSSVDGAILVIAADDGVMPQTHEHFEILQLLGIEQGIIALTKIDLAEEEWRELVIDDIRNLTAGTFLEGAPILPISNKTGAGMEEFKVALDELIASARPRIDRGLFRMWLDRSFTVKGAGTIVAGTVLSGSVKVGDKVEILPAGREAHVKSIQLHNRDVNSSRIGERSAINLPGVNKDEVKRGDLLATPDHYRPTYMLNARLNLLNSQSKPLENRTRLEHIGRIIILERKLIEPGSSGLVQFRLEDQAMADIGDRFVVRGFSSCRAIGGGIVLETHPRKLKYADEEEVKRLQRLETGEPREIVLQSIQKAAEKTIDASTLAKEVAFLVGEVIDIIGALQRDGEVKVLHAAPKWQVVNEELYSELCEKIIAFLDEFHREQKHIKGVRRSDLRASLMPKAAQVLFEGLLRNLSDSGVVKIEGELVWKSEHQVTFSPEQIELKQKIADIYLERSFNPPSLIELADETALQTSELEPIVVGLCELGELMKFHGPDGKPFYFHKKSIVKAQEILQDFFKDHNEMRFFEFRELIGSSRKYTTPILMHFDDIGLTYRDGEVRKLRDKG